MSRSTWLYQLNGQPAPDPVTAEELSALRELRVIYMNTLVRQNRAGSNWVTLEEVWNNPVPVVPEAQAVEEMIRRLGVKLPSSTSNIPAAPPSASHPQLARHSRLADPPEPSIVPPDQSWGPAVQSLLHTPTKPGLPPLAAPLPKPTPSPAPIPARAPSRAATGGRRTGRTGKSGLGGTPRAPIPRVAWPAVTASIPSGSPLRPASNAQAVSPPRRRRRPMATLAIAVMLAVLVAGSVIVLQHQNQDAVGPPPDTFMTGLQQAIGAAVRPDWQALRGFSELLLQHPTRRVDLLPHVTNYLNVAGSILQLPSPEFALTTNVIIAAAEAGCLPAQRLLVRGGAAAGLDLLREAWLARVSESLVGEMHAVTASLGSTNIESTLDAYRELLGRCAEIEPLILSNCCVALGQLERGDITADVHTQHQHFLHQIADTGCTEAHRILGDRELPFDSKRQEVHQHYLAAAGGGSVHAQYQLGLMAARGMIDGTSNWTNAYAWFERAAAAGSISARDDLGTILLSTNLLPHLPTRERIQRAVALLEQICRIPGDARLARSDVRKFEQALVHLGTILLKANFGQTGRVEDGLNLLERAARRSNDRACLLLGVHLAGLDYAGRVSTTRNDFATGVGYLDTAAASVTPEIAKNALAALEQAWQSRDPKRAQEYANRLRNFVGPAP